METKALVAELQRIRAALGTACEPNAPWRKVVDIAVGNIRTAWEHDGLVDQIDQLKKELARGRFGDLKPRAIAVLCALRSGPKTTNQLGSGIGDGTSSAGRQETRGLLDSMRSRALIVQRNDQPPRWYLDHDGLGWLESNGLTATPEARAWNVPGYELAVRP